MGDAAFLFVGGTNGRKAPKHHNRIKKGMVMKTNNVIGLFLSVLGVLGLVACGGGGGGGGDPAPTGPTGLTYTGVTTQAVIDVNNAAELAGEAFLGGETGSDIGLFSSVGENQSKKVREIKLYEVVPIFGNALYKIDFGSQGGDLLAVKTDRDTILGDCGGSANYIVNMDDVSGAFTGLMTFSNFCNENSTISGNADFSGRIDVNSGTFLDFYLAINMVDLTSGGQSYVVDGAVSVELSGSSVTASIDMLMKDSSGEVFWVKDYTLKIAEGTDYVDIEVSGRFYHPAHGYVDLTTMTPFHTNTLDDWPSSGELMIVGGLGTKARLIATDENVCQVFADTNGDGAYDYDSGPISWYDL
ncbi:MAG: hypothetical protein R6V60_19130 [Desulfobacterales bacterium]